MYGQMTEIVGKMTTDRADLRFIFLTLTVENPEGQDLSATIDAMNKGFALWWINQKSSGYQSREKHSRLVQIARNHVQYRNR